MNYKSLLSLLVLMLVAALMTGCVDVPADGPTPPEYKAQFRFVHAANDVGDVAVSVDGQSVGNLSFAGVIPHSEFLAGSRTVKLGNEEFPVAMSTEQRGTVVVLDQQQGARAYIKLVERRLFDAETTEQGNLRLVHAAKAPAVDLEVVGSDTSFAYEGVGYEAATPYAKIPAGTYEVMVYAAGDTNAILTTSVNVGNKRHSSLVVGDAEAGTLSFLNLEDN
ncbi:DUF4397 domain-containing protein [candidate division KSB1 bacterium]|jgi:hypothetical protein|nr:DUF4397 domain-containing protein [candidate division KSB1 bacterium]